MRKLTPIHGIINRKPTLEYTKNEIFTQSHKEALPKNASLNFERLIFLRSGTVKGCTLITAVQHPASSNHCKKNKRETLERRNKTTLFADKMTTWKTTTKLQEIINEFIKIQD